MAVDSKTPRDHSQSFSWEAVFSILTQSFHCLRCTLESFRLCRPYSSSCCTWVSNPFGNSDLTSCYPSGVDVCFHFPLRIYIPGAWMVKQFYLLFASPGTLFILGQYFKQARRKLILAVVDLNALQFLQPNHRFPSP